MTAAAVLFTLSALAYARERAWLVVPLHDVTAGHCSCHEGATCRSAGKHPRIADWEREASADPAKLAEWSAAYPGAGVGLAVGRSGLLVLDVDPDKGGDTSLAALIAEHGELPETVQQLTGSGGAHFFFKMPPGLELRNTAGRLAPGLDTRGAGGMVVLAPSRSAKGAYSWVRDPFRTPIADAPAWLLELLTAARELEPGQSSTERGFFPSAVPETIEAARIALDRHGPAIDGKGGGLHTVQAAAILTHDFALTDEEAWPLLVEWNATCVPPWELEGRNSLREKLRNGRKYGKGAYGARRSLDVELRLRKLIADAGGGDVMKLVEAARPLFAQAGDPTRHTLMARELASATGLKVKELGLCRPVDQKRAAEQSARQQQMDSGGPFIDPRAPLDAAERLLASKRDAEGMNHLVRWQAEWLKAGTPYTRQPAESIAAEIYHFTKGKSDVTTGAPIKPGPALVEPIVHALKAAAAIPNVVRTPAWISGDEPHQADEIVAFPNGLLHIPTRAFIPASARFFTLNAAGFNYNPQAPRPAAFEAFLHQLWGDDTESIETLQELAGLALTSDTSFQKLFLLVGPKRSGKGTLARVLTELVGVDNVTAPTLNGIGQHFGLEPLIAKTLGIISDARLSSRTDLGAVVENLLRISGEDTISVPRKHREDWTARLTTRFLIISNELPGFLDQSGALASRFVVLRLTRSFFGQEDRALTQRLLGELPGILLWALGGLDRLRARGYFRQPASSLEMVKQLADLASPIKAFVADCCEVGPGAAVEVGVLFNTWCGWVAEQGRDHAGSKQIFGRNLSAAFPELRITQPRVNGGRERRYEGIGLAVARSGTRAEPLQLSDESKNTEGID